MIYISPTKKNENVDFFYNDTMLNQSILWSTMFEILSLSILQFWFFPHSMQSLNNNTQ